MEAKLGHVCRSQLAREPKAFSKKLSQETLLPFELHIESLSREKPLAGTPVTAIAQLAKVTCIAKLVFCLGLVDHTRFEAVSSKLFVRCTQAAPTCKYLIFIL